jgi:glutamyl-tRNA synthetase
MDTDFNNKDRKVRTRFAPSPTGFMHVGNVRTAIFAYLWAKKNNGTFILRIEDTDKAREVSGSKEHILEALKWLNIKWDEGPEVLGPHTPYIQSERLHIYQTYAKYLLDKGFAYVDGMEEEEIEKLRQKSESENKPFLYREHRVESNEEYKGVGQTLRFKIKEVRDMKWNDVVFGNLKAGVEALDDFVLIKSDGYPTYNFAHVVDDIEMEVTHVMRGQEFISSTPKFLALYEALEKVPPIFVSLPHILGDSGQKKLGKRDGAKDILEYREEGYEPEGLFNFLAFLGFNPGGEKEVYTHNELIEAFDINRIQKSGARFNDDKLDWFNKEHLKKISFERQVSEVTKKLEKFKDLKNYNQDVIKKITPVVIDHISKWSDIESLIENGDLGYYFEEDINISDLNKINWKENDLSVSLSNLSEVLSVLNDNDIDNLDYDSTKALIWPVAQKNGVGDVLWPLRYVLSGKDKSPDPFMLIHILGKEISIKRIQNILNKK